MLVMLIELSLTYLPVICMQLASYSRVLGLESQVFDHTFRPCLALFLYNAVVVFALFQVLRFTSPSQWSLRAPQTCQNLTSAAAKRPATPP